MRKFHFILAAFATLLLNSAAHAAIPKDIAPLKEGELAQLCGGFILPSGLGINVGIDNRISVGSQLLADTTLNLNGATVTTTSTGAWHIQGSNGSTDVSQVSAAGATIITNTASNISLDQTRTITIDMSNLTHQALLSMHGFSAIQAQAINSIKNGLH